MKITKHKLGKLCDIRIGRTPARANASYWGEGNPWLSIADMKEKYVTRTKEEITDRAVKECNCTIVPKGTLLMSFKLSIGKMAIAGRDMFTNEAIAAFVPKNKELDVEYLYYALKHYSFGSLNVAAKGATLNKSSLALLSVPVPESIDDQRRIATLLSRAEVLIAQRKESIRLLDELVRSVFLEMFGDPVWNEKGWPMLRVDSTAEARLGKMLDKKNWTGTGLRKYLRNTNVQWKRFNLTEVHEMDFSAKEREEFRLVSGDILMCEGGEVGRCAIWREEIAECYFQKAVHRLRLDGAQVLPEYFVHLFWELIQRNGLSKQTTSSTIAHLTGEKLASLRVPVPPVSVQRRFEELVHSQNIVRGSYVQSLAGLEQLYGSLSQRAFRGELEFGESESRQTGSLIHEARSFPSDQLGPVNPVGGNAIAGDELSKPQGQEPRRILKENVYHISVDLLSNPDQSVFAIVEHVVHTSDLAHGPFSFRMLLDMLRQHGLSYNYEEVRDVVFAALSGPKAFLRQVYSAIDLTNHDPEKHAVYLYFNGAQ